MMLRNLLSLTLVVSLSLGAAAADRPLPRPAPALEMEDQFGDEHSLGAYRGEVVVLVYADKKGALASRDLGAKLHVHFHPEAEGKPPAEAALAPVRPIPGWPPDRPSTEVRLVPLAAIGKVPGLLQPLVRREFRKASPDAPIWLDLGDALRREFGLQPGVPNVVVVDPRGQVRLEQGGALEEAAFAGLVEEIEALRRAVGAAPTARLAEQPPPRSPSLRPTPTQPLAETSTEQRVR
jgi:hypothetical protein